MKYGQILASTALSQRMKRATLDRDATQAFLLAAKTACTYTWDHTGRCSCHMPPELVIAARHLQISLCRDTTLAWRQLLWHNQVTHNDWIRDHNSRPLQSAPFDTFADAFQSNTTTTYWSFIPRHTATIQDKAHLPWFFMLSAGLGLQATAPLLNPQSRVWFPTPPPRTNLRQQGSYVKRLSTTIGTHLHPPSPIDHKYADRRAALCADLNLPYRPDAWTRPWHASYLPGSLQWFQYRWHFQAFRFKHSSINPLCPYCGNPDKSSHTFWTCPRAHALWTTLLQIWYGDVAAKPSDYIANLTSAEQPRAARWMLQAPQWKTHGTAYDNLCHQGWTLLRSLGFRILWTERCKAIHADPLAPPALPSHLPTVAMSHFQALATYHSHQHHTLRAAVYSALVQQCRRASAGPTVSHHMPIPSRGLILFDGAARMETCCGGSGAIAMPHHAPLLSEYDAHFLATATTNNIADYMPDQSPHPRGFYAPYPRRGVRRQQPPHESLARP
ncbi:hypothetical protein B5M09_008628 [Aphanomyces astaci]|uniref:Uncharacterized protein n=1 Tax=Aphanomyces astaci TaxID=112090 RepID=A0A3R7YSY3_APHAT|nr:hypothetical protein B5M09_008628 [Aphanomyces astaci]